MRIEQYRQQNGLSSRKSQVFQEIQRRANEDLRDLKLKERSDSGMLRRDSRIMRARNSLTTNNQSTNSILQDNLQNLEKLKER